MGRDYWLEAVCEGFAEAGGGDDEADFCLEDFLAFFFAILTLLLPLPLRLRERFES